jgi:hypothetical protein
VGIVYDAGLLLALVTGCAIGALAVFAHCERAARRRWAYEREAAEGREIYAALGAYRHIKPGRAPGRRPSTGVERGGFPACGREARPGQGFTMMTQARAIAERIGAVASTLRCAR